MGRNGAKKRSLLSGHSSAAPWPAFVQVSRSECETAQTRRYSHGPKNLLPDHLQNALAARIEVNSAKATE